MSTIVTGATSHSAECRSEYSIFPRYPSTVQKAAPYATHRCYKTQFHVVWLPTKGTTICMRLSSLLLVFHFISSSTMTTVTTTPSSSPSRSAQCIVCVAAAFRVLPSFRLCLCVYVCVCVCACLRVFSERWLQPVFALLLLLFQNVNDDSSAVEHYGLLLLRKLL